MRTLTTVGLLLLLSVGLAMGQVTLSLPTTTAANGTDVILPVSVTGFNHVGSFSLTITFDKNALTFNGVANQPTFGSFNSTAAALANTNGSLSIAWFNVSPALNIGSGTLLNLLFTHKTGASNVTFANTSSVTDSTGTSLTRTLTSGSVSGIPSRMVLGTPPVSPSKAGDTVYVPLNGDNLVGLGSISVKIGFDPTKVTFVRLLNTAVGFTPPTVSNGILTLGWFSTSPFSLNTGKIADLMFTYIADSTNVTFVGPNQVTDSVGNNVSIVYVNGKITKTPAPPPPPVGLSIPSQRAVANIDITVPINVTQMNNIGSLSLKINYDQTKLAFKRIDGFVPTVSPSAVGGVLTVAWFSTTPLNIGTGNLMNLVFTYTGGTSVVSFAGTSLVTDGSGNSLSLTFTPGTITQDSLPHFTAIAAKTVNQGDSLAFATLATDADAGDALTYTAGTLPAGAVFNAVGKSFGWKPGFAFTPGVYPVTFYVMDPVGGRDSVTVQITVVRLNQKPSFVNKLAAQSVAQNATVSFTYTATDPNNDPLTYSLVGAPAGATVTAAGVFSWKLAYSQLGAFTITAVVSDGALTDTATAVITVTRTNVKPTITAKLADATVAQNTPISFTYLATDPNLDTVRFSIVTPPAGATITAAGVFAWTPKYSQVGAFSIIVVASDGQLTDTATTTITVTKVNVKPVVNKQVPAAGALSTVSVNNVQSFAVSVVDPNLDPVTFTWYVNNVMIKTGTDTSYGIRWTGAHGTAEVVKVVFADPAGLKDSVTWNFTLTRVAMEEGIVPTEFELSQNYPNPFNPSTKIGFDLPKEAPVSLEIYNILGVKIRTLMSGQTASAGRYTAKWDGKDETGVTVPSGVYLYRIIAGDFHASKKMMLLK
jgi:hypothetical protein